MICCHCVTASSCCREKPNQLCYAFLRNTAWSTLFATGVSINPLHGVQLPDRIWWGLQVRNDQKLREPANQGTAQTVEGKPKWKENPSGRSQRKNHQRNEFPWDVGLCQSLDLSWGAILEITTVLILSVTAADRNWTERREAGPHALGTGGAATGWDRVGGSRSWEHSEQRLWASWRDPKESCRQWPVWDQECCFLQYAKLLICASWRGWRVFLKRDRFKLIKTCQDQARNWEDMVLGLTPLLFFLVRTEMRLQFIPFLCNKFRRKDVFILKRGNKTSPFSPPGTAPFGTALWFSWVCTIIYAQNCWHTPTWQRVLMALCLPYLSNLILQGCKEPFPLLILPLKASESQWQERLLAQQGHASGEANTALH